ncbi:hypothetical protein BX600DRAFT_133230 [Xylariales sp. PMI_506]|nr:hypothetical protein BX600DRAFT_133230 [Xylariales sp. PMI_506]
MEVLYLLPTVGLIGWLLMCIGFVQLATHQQLITVGDICVPAYPALPASKRPLVGLRPRSAHSISAGQGRSALNSRYESLASYGHRHYGLRK